jgi:hypothetical protein
MLANIIILTVSVSELELVSGIMKLFGKANKGSIEGPKTFPGVGGEFGIEVDEEDKLGEEDKFENGGVTKGEEVMEEEKLIGEDEFGTGVVGERVVVEKEGVVRKEVVVAEGVVREVVGKADEEEIMGSFLHPQIALRGKPGQT